MIREEEIIRLRPFIETIEPDKIKSEVEGFQSSVLRPILKYQHDVLISLIKENNHYTNLAKEINNGKDTLVSIKNFLNKETQLKFTLTGTLIGLFTVSELNFYSENSKELNKRIIQMIAQRFFDNKSFN